MGLTTRGARTAVQVPLVAMAAMTLVLCIVLVMSVVTATPRVGQVSRPVRSPVSVVGLTLHRSSLLTFSRARNVRVRNLSRELPLTSVTCWSLGWVRQCVVRVEAVVA